MVTILPPVENRQTFMQKLGGGIEKGLDIAEKYANEYQQGEALKKSGYGHLAGLSPELQKVAIAEDLKSQSKMNLFREKAKALGIDLESPKKSFKDNLMKEPSEKSNESEMDIEDQFPSNEEIAKHALIDPSVAREERAAKNMAIKEKGKKIESQRKQFEADREYHSKVSRPIVEQATERLKSSMIQKGVRSQLRKDIESGETSGFFPYAVDKMGLESFRSPESARFSSEVKNLFVVSLNEIPGARPNQFIERFLSYAQPLIGRNVEANLSVLDVDDFIQDIKDEQAKQELKLAKEDREKSGYVKEDISERAFDKMGDFVNRRQEKMAQDIRTRHEKDMSAADLMSEVLNGKVIKGTPLTPKMMKIFYIKNDKDVNKALQEAEKAGFILPEYMD